MVISQSRAHNISENLTSNWQNVNQGRHERANFKFEDDFFAEMVMVIVH